jgi:2-dehydropantoate 2-reductase
MRPRIAIVGAGAVGAYIGGHLSRSGADVALIDQYPAHVAEMRATGLRLSGLEDRDNFTQHVTAMHVCDVQQLAHEQPVDIALVAVKGYDTAWATALILPYLAPQGVVASAQNGMNDARVAAIAGDGRVLGVSVTGCGVELFAPGCVRRANVAASGHVVFRVGELRGPATPRARELASLLSSVDHADVTDDLASERWTKLVLNSMRMGLAAVTGLNIPEQDQNAVTRSLMIRLGAEAVKVGLALGHSVGPMQGIQPDDLVKAAEGNTAALERVEGILLAAAKRYRSNTPPSLAQDMARGRRTEIDDINGHVVRSGVQAGVPTSMNAAILDLVQRLERREFIPNLDSVKCL